VGKYLEYIIDPTTISDPDGDKLTFDALMAPGSSLPTFPSWLTYDNINLAFKGTAN
jgi:hypothetical protein